MNELIESAVYLVPPVGFAAMGLVLRGNYRRSLVSSTNFRPSSSDQNGQSVSKEITTYQAPVEKKVYESFGHPAPPILLLQASMPSAPLGYAWEITTGINDVGNPCLRLAMLDMKSSTVIDAIEGDLVIIRRWKYAKDDTYADFYRRCAQQQRDEHAAEYRKWNDQGERYRAAGAYGSTLNQLMLGYPKPVEKTDNVLAGKVMLANLITPIVDWAALITLRYIVEHPDETKCNYVLIESTQGAA